MNTRPYKTRSPASARSRRKAVQHEQHLSRDTRGRGVRPVRGDHRSRSQLDKPDIELARRVVHAGLVLRMPRGSERQAFTATRAGDAAMNLEAQALNRFHRWADTRRRRSWPVAFFVRLWLAWVLLQISSGASW